MSMSSSANGADFERSSRRSNESGLLLPCQEPLYENFDIQAVASYTDGHRSIPLSRPSIILIPNIDNEKPSQKIAITARQKTRQPEETFTIIIQPSPQSPSTTSNRNTSILHMNPNLPPPLHNTHPHPQILNLPLQRLHPSPLLHP